MAADSALQVAAVAAGEYARSVFPPVVPKQIKQQKHAAPLPWQRPHSHAERAQDVSTQASDVLLCSTNSPEAGDNWFTLIKNRDRPQIVTSEGRGCLLDEVINVLARD